MRFLLKLYSCAAAVLLVITYFFYQQHTIGFMNTVPAAWHGKAHRVVVFGDDWSDTGSYRVSPPSASSASARDHDRGEMWTETLCQELDCNVIDNFARSLPNNSESEAYGSVIDSDIHAQAMGRKSRDDTLVDFKTQVQQFLTHENRNYHIAQRLRRTDEWTVFTVFFGLWDLLEYSKLEKDFAMRAIDESVAVLFEQFDLLATHMKAPVKIVLPMMVDPTFLPHFRRKRHNNPEHFAEAQHQMVFLWTYWNAVLFRTATGWHNGEVYAPNLNALLMDLVRVHQLNRSGVVESSGAAPQAPLIAHVKRPCMRFGKGSDMGRLPATAVEKCSDPATYLFWDALHLSGTTHQLIGRHAASLLHNNQTADAGESIPIPVAPASNYAATGREGERFILKYPPGY